MTTHVALGPGPEFDVVRAMLARYGVHASGVGDDAAEIPIPAGESAVVSTDVAVENVHFRRDWMTAEQIAARATTAALSDLAAMAATPRAVVVAVTLPESWRGDAGAIAAGVARAASTVGASVVGGDVSDGPVLSLAVTVIGSAVRVLRRSGARPGDAVWVTGALGGPAAALRALLAGAAPAPALLERFASPVVRWREGQWLAAHGATAAIDVSDGIAADVAHLAAASGVRIVLDLDQLPVFAGATRDDASTGGEEYELAVAAPASLDASAFAAACGVPITQIGVVEAGPVGVIARVEGREVALPPGFSHFVR